VSEAELSALQKLQTRLRGRNLLQKLQVGCATDFVFVRCVGDIVEKVRKIDKIEG